MPRGGRTQQETTDEYRTFAAAAARPDFRHARADRQPGQPVDHHRAGRGGADIATLAAPLAAPRREIIEGATWRCEGDRCAAPANGGRAMAVCGKVARKFGTITRFTSPQGELSAEQLARCNG
jgi:hypothetical protein